MLCGWNWNHMQAAMHGRGRGRRQAGRAQHNSQITCETAQKRQKVESARRGGREEVTSACTGAHALARRERARDKDRAYIAAARCSARACARDRKQTGIRMPRCTCNLCRCRKLGPKAPA